jgi:hypothetical protein
MKERWQKQCQGWLFFGLLAVGAVTESSCHSRSKPDCENNSAERNYTVYFQWDATRTNIRVVDAHTASEEASTPIRNALLRESASDVKKLQARTGLSSAQGSASLSLLGCGEPYLIRWSYPELPKLSELFGAAAGWNLSVLEKLLSDGMNVNARGFGGQTPLMAAAKDPTRHLTESQLAKLPWKPNSETVDFLLREGADPNAKDDEGLTVLMLADSSSVSKLIQAGADVNAQDDIGLTALMFHTLRGDVRAMESDLAAGAHVNAVDRDGRSALMYAADQGSYQAIKDLIAAGATLSAKGKNGETAFDIGQKRLQSDPSFQRALRLLSPKQ